MEGVCCCQRGDWRFSCEDGTCSFLYLQHLLDSTQSYSVVNSAIYALQWVHNLAGLPSPVDASIIRDISKAAKKMNGARVVNRKQAVKERKGKELYLSV